MIITTDEKSPINQTTMFPLNVHRIFRYTVWAEKDVVSVDIGSFLSRDGRTTPVGARALETITIIVQIPSKGLTQELLEQALIKEGDNTAIDEYMYQTGYTLKNRNLFVGAEFIKE